MKAPADNQSRPVEERDSICWKKTKYRDNCKTAVIPSKCRSRFDERTCPLPKTQQKMECEDWTKRKDYVNQVFVCEIENVFHFNITV